jgi:hypothetical protein
MTLVLKSFSIESYADALMRCLLACLRADRWRNRIGLHYSNSYLVAGLEDHPPSGSTLSHVYPPTGLV